jgi:uroporphyrinogen-III synthase
MIPLEPRGLCKLGGRGILVTRAVHQAAGLCDLIKIHGGKVVSFPAVRIEGPADQVAVRRQLARIESYHTVIFISPNAVSWGLRLLPGERLPEELQLCAVGDGTARALAVAGYPVDVVPQDGFDSESLLEAPELRKVSGQRILIFRGNGGRALLGETLQERGAEVEYAEVYRRLPPSENPAPLLRRWKDEIDLVTVTSAELLENLFSHLGEEGEQLLRDTPLVVVSERMRTLARERGCRSVILAEGAGEDALLAAICRWVSGSSA